MSGSWPISRHIKLLNANINLIFLGLERNLKKESKKQRVTVTSGNRKIDIALGLGLVKYLSLKVN